MILLICIIFYLLCLYIIFKILVWTYLFNKLELTLLSVFWPIIILVFLFILFGTFLVDLFVMFGIFLKKLNYKIFHKFFNVILFILFFVFVGNSLSNMNDNIYFFYTKVSENRKMIIEYKKNFKDIFIILNNIIEAINSLDRNIPLNSCLNEFYFESPCCYYVPLKNVYDWELSEEELKCWEDRSSIRGRV